MSSGAGPRCDHQVHTWCLTPPIPVTWPVLSHSQREVAVWCSFGFVLLKLQKSERSQRRAKVQGSELDPSMSPESHPCHFPPQVQFLQLHSGGNGLEGVALGRRKERHIDGPLEIVRTGRTALLLLCRLDFILHGPTPHPASGGQIAPDLLGYPGSSSSDLRCLTSYLRSRNWIRDLTYQTPTMWRP